MLLSVPPPIVNVAPDPPSAVAFPSVSVPVVSVVVPLKVLAPFKFSVPPPLSTKLITAVEAAMIPLSEVVPVPPTVIVFCPGCEPVIAPIESVSVLLLLVNVNASAPAAVPSVTLLLTVSVPEAALVTRKPPPAFRLINPLLSVTVPSSNMMPRACSVPATVTA